MGDRWSKSIANGVTVSNWERRMKKLYNKTRSNLEKEKLVKILANIYLPAMKLDLEGISKKMVDLRSKGGYGENKRRQ